ncbi:MAG: hypothetical protein R2822_19975 [Spirosomataceae bacterium]
MTTRSKWAYRRDERFDYGNPQKPNLPSQTHSLHVGYTWGNDKLNFDSHHASPAGCYLGALVWYGFLFEESPVSLRFTPPGISNEFANQLRKTAWKTVKKERKGSK